MLSTFHCQLSYNLLSLLEPLPLGDAVVGLIKKVIDVLGLQVKGSGSEAELAEDQVEAVRKILIAATDKLESTTNSRRRALRIRSNDDGASSSSGLPSSSASEPLPTSLDTYSSSATVNTTTSTIVASSSITSESSSSPTSSETPVTARVRILEIRTRAVTASGWTRGRPGASGSRPGPDRAPARPATAAPARPRGTPARGSGCGWS